MRRLGIVIGILGALVACGDDDDDDSVDASIDADHQDARIDGRADGALPEDDAEPDAPPPDASDDADADASSPGCELDLPSLSVEEIAAGFDWEDPLFLAQAPGNTDTLWVVDQGGKIFLVRDDEVLETPFFDISEMPLFAYDPDGGETGLLGLAFHPDYATNGRFFVYYTTYETEAEVDFRDVIAEYVVSANADVADPSEVVRLVDEYDPQPNHNGGMLAFGPDGYLYAGIGDGGGAGDEHPVDFDPPQRGSGQNLSLLFGKILRLDVDAVDAEYAPATNPFASDDDDMTRAQIWAYGLRNPFRFSFDSATGDLWIGDVGQNTYEEIDFQPASSTGGENYGWRRYEGLHDFDDELGDITETMPIAEFRHMSDETLRGACSITGGYVYRGTEIEDAAGIYFFGDFCSQDIVAIARCEDEPMIERVEDLSGIVNGIAGFGQDNAGNLYLVDHGFYPGLGRPLEGAIYRVTTD